MRLSWGVDYNNAETGSGKHELLLTILARFSPPDADDELPFVSKLSIGHERRPVIQCEPVRCQTKKPVGVLQPQDVVGREATDGFQRAQLAYVVRIVN